MVAKDFQARCFEGWSISNFLDLRKFMASQPTPPLAYTSSEIRVYFSALLREANG